MTAMLPAKFQRALRLFNVAAIAFLLAGATHGFAAPIPLPPEPSRPDAEAGPTKVAVGMWAIDITNVDSADQTFSASLFISLRWRDPHLAHSGQGVLTYALGDIWHPKWFVENSGGSLKQIFSDKVNVTADGTVVWHQLFLGAFTQKFNLRQFPFDSQKLRARFVVLGHRPEEIQFVPDETLVAAGFPQGTGMAPTLTITDWKVDAPTAFAEPYNAAPGLEIAGYSFEFSAARQSTYYLLKVILPLLLILMMSWTVFWIDPCNGSSQISVATTSMLTLIAYRFAIGAEVPKLSYLTRLDAFILMSSVLVFLALMEVMVTTHLAVINKPEMSLTIDRRCRIIFPLVFVILSAATFLR